MRYALFECVYLRPWPGASPWIARIEEMLSRLDNRNKVQTYLGVRWFYRRRDLLPSGEAEFPACEDSEHEVYYCRGKLDEVKCSTLVRRSTRAGSRHTYQRTHPSPRTRHALVRPW